MTISKVVLLGADGNLGPAVLRALVANGFNVTILKRKSSKSTTSYPNQTTVSDEFPIDELVQVLKGKDAVVVTIKGSQTDLQKRIADACVRAGVKRFVPADFGSCDSSSSLTQELVPLYKRKTEMREYLQSLAKKNPGFSWTSIVCGHFFDWSLEFLHLWLHERKADILDDGETKFSASTLAQVGEATARVLQRPEVSKDRMLYIQSFLVSQNEVIKAAERATGTKWKITRYNSKEYRDLEKKKADAGDLDAVENLVWYLGTVDANWETRQNFAMKELGLANEDLDAVVRRTVEKLSKL